MPARTHSAKTLSDRTTGPRLFLTLLLLGGIGLGCPGQARAGRDEGAGANLRDRPGDGPPTVSVMPFNGKEAATPPRKPILPLPTSEVIVDVLRDRQRGLYQVLGPNRWKHTAENRFHGRTYEVQGIAKVLGADLVIGGWLEATPNAETNKSHRLTIALYNNWAEPLGQLSYDLDLDPRRPRLDAPTLATRLSTLFQMVDRALGLTTPKDQARPNRPNQMARPANVVQAEDQEKAPLPREGEGEGEGEGRAARNGEFAQGPFVPPNPEANELYYRRPPWRSIFDLQVGYLFNVRHLTDNGSGREFNRSGAHGVLLHGELYPLAAFDRVPLAAAGLGFRVTAMLPFWPDIQQIPGPDLPPTGILSASEYRVEVGFLHWHWNFLEAVLRPEVEMEALYGYHRFDITDKANVLLVDIPSAAYSYLGGSIGARVHLTRRLSTRLSFAFAGLLDLGPMGLPGALMDDPRNAGRGFHVYGPGSGWLWRLDFSAALRVWHGLSLGAGFYYEQTLLSFDGTGDVALRVQPTPVVPGIRQKVTSATDEYGGFFLTAGYVY